jgi:hypothetical protein
MSEEKRDFPESRAENRPYETSAIKVKFGGTAASLLQHFLGISVWRRTHNRVHLIITTALEAPEFQSFSEIVGRPVEVWSYQRAGECAQTLLKRVCSLQAIHTYLEAG